jgi:thymidylate synthase (FAD)
MTVSLLSATNLQVADIAIAKCYNSKVDENVVNKKRMHNVANVSKHASTIEHLVYSFDIDGISRACLQELARHRVASLTVKSSRYTLKELKKESFFVESNTKKAWKYLVRSDNHQVNIRAINALNALIELVKAGVPNDQAKYCMPEAYKTSLVWTINARSLQNFLALRLDSHALWEMRILAQNIYERIPAEHSFLFDHLVQEEQ